MTVVAANYNFKNLLGSASTSHLVGLSVAPEVTSTTSNLEHAGVRLLGRPPVCH